MSINIIELDNNIHQIARSICAECNLIFENFNLNSIKDGVHIFNYEKYELIVYENDNKLHSLVRSDTNEDKWTSKVHLFRIIKGQYICVYKAEILSECYEHFGKFNDFYVLCNKLLNVNEIVNSDVVSKFQQSAFWPYVFMKLLRMYNDTIDAHKCIKQFMHINGHDVLGVLCDKSYYLVTYHDVDIFMLVDFNIDEVKAMLVKIDNMNNLYILMKYTIKNHFNDKDIFYNEKMYLYKQINIKEI